MKRRLFIQRSLLFTGALTLRFKNTFSFTRNARVTGKVTAAGKPLANVLVSDGFNFVQTDNDGSYQLTPDAKAEYVFVSIPSGYHFPHNDSVAKFYHPLKNNNSFDFDLMPLDKSDDKHSFIIWADPQVKNESDVLQMMETSVPDVQQLVKEIGEGELLHGICVGDIVWDNHKLFATYNKAVAQMGIPFFQALGNHDEDYGLGGDETSDQTFKSHYGPTYYSFNRGKAHYVVMDNVRYLGTGREYDGYITDDQLNWLKKDLQFVPKDSLVIVSLHIPVHNAVKNNHKLYELLASYKNAHIMSGHTHYNRNVVTKNIYEHNHGAVCGAWWTGPICEDGTPRGYGVYHVDGNNLKWYYKSTGQPKTNQISIFVDKLTDQQRVVANVWNWDPEWKVEYWVDDKHKGTMENIKGYDPLAVKLYLGDKLPEQGRHFAEPKKNDHIFIAHLSAEAKKIKVVATDRFGEKYVNEMSI